MIFACGHRRMQRLYNFSSSFSLITNYATDSDDNLKKLATCVKFLKMEKSLLGWDLENLETVTQGIRDGDSDDESDD